MDRGGRDLGIPGAVGFANGHTRDLQGRLIGCSHRRPLRDSDGARWVGHDSGQPVQGKRLNGPNDVVVSRDGAIWVSDPHYGGSTDYEGGKHAMELPATLYRLQPGGEPEIAADDFDGPNGLCFSPDERLLYVRKARTVFRKPCPAHTVFDVEEGALHRGRVSMRCRPVLPTGCAATAMGGCGAARAMACTASTRTGPCSARS